MEKKDLLDLLESLRDKIAEENPHMTIETGDSPQWILDQAIKELSGCGLGESVETADNTLYQVPFRYQSGDGGIDKKQLEEDIGQYLADYGDGDTMFETTLKGIVKEFLKRLKEVDNQ